MIWKRNLALNNEDEWDENETLALNNEDEWDENETLHLIMMMVKKLYRKLFT